MTQLAYAAPVPTPENALQMSDLESMRITTPRSSVSAGWEFEMLDFTGEYSLGNIEDNLNEFVDDEVLPSPQQVMISAADFFPWDMNIPAGDTIVLTYDGGQQLTVYLPAIASPPTNWIIYPAIDGSTYWDQALTQLAYGVAKSPDEVVTITYQSATLEGKTTDVYINIVDTTTTRAIVAISSATEAGLVLFSNLYDIQPDGAIFSPPASITFYYDKPLPEGIDEADLRVHRWDPDVGWIILTTIEQYTEDPEIGWIKVGVSEVSLFAILTPIPYISASINLDPDTLNLKSNGKWITCYIELPAGYDVGDINISSLAISSINDEEITPIFAKSRPTEIGDYDVNGIPELMVKFDRASLQELLSPAFSVKITVEGYLNQRQEIPEEEKGKGKGKGEKEEENQKLEETPSNLKRFIGSDIIRVIEPGKAEIISSSGGKITNPDGAEIEIPPGALEQEILITITSEKSASNKSQKLQPVGTGFRFGPDGIKFKKPVTITLSYKDVSFHGDEENLRIYYWNEKSKKWELIANSIFDSDNNTVSAQVTHFSLYRIMAPEPPDSSFVKGEIYSFPNPAKGGKKPTIHIECGIADRVEIKIYNIAGEIVHSVELDNSFLITFTPPGEIGLKYAYEYTWDIGNIASGVYIYLIGAEKSGYKRITELKKLAIIK